MSRKYAELPTNPPPGPAIDAEAISNEKLIRFMSKARQGDIIQVWWRIMLPPSTTPARKDTDGDDDEFVTMVGANTEKPAWILWQGHILKDAYVAEHGGPALLKVHWPGGMEKGSMRDGLFTWPPAEDDNPGLMFGQLAYVRRPPQPTTPNQGLVMKSCPAERIPKDTPKRNREEIELGSDGEDDADQQLHPRRARTQKTPAVTLDTLVHALGDMKDRKAGIYVTILPGLRVPQVINTPYVALFPHAYLQDTDFQRWDHDLQQLWSLHNVSFRQDTLRREFTYQLHTMQSTLDSVGPYTDDREVLHGSFAAAARMIAARVTATTGETAGKDVVKKFDAMWKKGDVDMETLLQATETDTSDSKTTTNPDKEKMEKMQQELVALKQLVAQKEKEKRADNFNIYIPKQSDRGGYHSFRGQDSFRGGGRGGGRGYRGRS